MTCDHKTLRHRKWMRFGDGTDYDIEVRICVGCGEWLSLGEATWNPKFALEHAIEGRAIQIAGGEKQMTNTEAAGYRGNENSPHRHLPGWHAGYLARIIADHDAEQTAIAHARIEDALRNLGQDLEVPPITVDDILPRLTPEERAKLVEDLDGIPQTEPEPFDESPISPLADTSLPESADDEPTGAHEKFDVSEDES